MDEQEEFKCVPFNMHLDVFKKILLKFLCFLDIVKLSLTSKKSTKIMSWDLETNHEHLLSGYKFMQINQNILRNLMGKVDLSLSLTNSLPTPSNPITSHLSRISLSGVPLQRLQKNSISRGITHISFIGNSLGDEILQPGVLPDTLISIKIQSTITFKLVKGMIPESAKYIFINDLMYEPDSDAFPEGSRVYFGNYYWPWKFPFPRWFNHRYIWVHCFLLKKKLDV